MKSNIKSFILGVIMTVLVTGILTVFAATIDVEIGGIRIFWDGEEKTLTDVNGEKVEPMIYNGTTYVPLRALAELAGKSVEWEEETTTVYIGGKPEEVVAATVNGTAITDDDINYHIYAQAAMYALQNGAADLSDITDYDWDRIENGFPISKGIKEKAIDSALNEAVTLQKGAEKGIVISEEEKTAIENQVKELENTYGKDGFELRVRTMGIPSMEQYEKMYKNAITMEKIQEDIENNPSSYYPADVNILKHYVKPDGASVKHILIQADETNKAEKKKQAEAILKRARSGEDFDALVAEFNEDPGAGTTGYTFAPGAMVKEFEDASFALDLGGISGIVETPYGFHIIKRIPGLYELQGYWRAEMGNNITIDENVLNAFDVNAVMADVVNASAELGAE